MARWNSANILKVSPEGRQLWKFSAEGERFVLEGEEKLVNGSLPSQVVAKDWRSLFRKKLNVAWLPADKVFLRVVQLPASTPAEMLSMVEFQLEKLSPIPVTQIVWSIEMLPTKEDKPGSLQSVIIIIAARDYVEEFLGDLEGQGYLADRLEVPSLDQLLATPVYEDGVWIYFSGPTEPVLLAWWYGGALQNLSLVPLPPGLEKAGVLKTQIEQVAWAGELEGWLTSPPRAHLVADPENAIFWEPPLREWTEQAVEVSPPTPAADLAALSAQRAAKAESKSNLLPQDFSVRYHQQFVDGLWMRGLFGVLTAYTIGVMIYFAALFVLQFQQQRVLAEVSKYSESYNNANRNEERIRILKDRQELKYAALDCWRVVAEGLPATVTVDEIYFQRGKFDPRGTVSVNDQVDVTKLNEAMRKATDSHGELLFTSVSPPTFNSRGGTADWKFSCTLRGGDNK